MQEYTITIAESSGAIIEQDEMGAQSPMDALRVYAADRGWRPEKDFFDEESGEYWEMRESDGTRIVVELMDG